LQSHVYLKAYREALIDFEVAVKNSSFADLALMSMQQKYKEKMAPRYFLWVTR
jgi:thiamine kinase-like enzyme